MRRTRLVILLLAAATALAGCGDIPLDDLGLSPEDQEAFEEALEDFAEAANDAQSGDGSSSGDSGDDSDSPPQDPDWSPPGMPPPPGEPTESSDYTDGPGCPPGRTCGHANYGDDTSGQDARDHYEDVFGRPPDVEESFPRQTADGKPYDATSSTWTDDDAEVNVYTDEHGTDVNVKTDPTP